MSKQEILVTPLGEMKDMIACLSIYQGTAKQRSAKKWSYDEAINLR